MAKWVCAKSMTYDKAIHRNTGCNRLSSTLVIVCLYLVTNCDHDIQNVTQNFFNV